MRIALLLVGLTLLAAPATADDLSRRRPHAPTRCVDVEVEGRRSFNCLNDVLRAETARAGAPQIAAPLDSRSPDLRLGIINMPAVQQQYGRNFGVSVVPYRPARP